MSGLERRETGPNLDPSETLARNFKQLFPMNNWQDLRPGVLDLRGAPFLDSLFYYSKILLVRYQCSKRSPILVRDDPYRMNQLHLSLRLETPLVAYAQEAADLEQYKKVLGKDESFGGTATRIFNIHGEQYPVNIAGIYKKGEPKAIMLYKKGVKESKPLPTMPKLVYSSL